MLSQIPSLDGTRKQCQVDTVNVKTVTVVPERAAAAKDMQV